MIINELLIFLDVVFTFVDMLYTGCPLKYYHKMICAASGGAIGFDVMFLWTLLFLIKIHRL